jgi:hypothetical protein
MTIFKRRLTVKKWIVALLFVPAAAVACKEGFVPSDTPGVCIEKAVDKPMNPAWVSDEKPPKDKMPSYEREGVHAVNAPPGVEPGSGTAHDFAAESNGK